MKNVIYERWITILPPDELVSVQVTDEVNGIALWEDGNMRDWFWKEETFGFDKTKLQSEVIELAVRIGNEKATPEAIAVVAEARTHS